jgi:hypothetical protein
MGGLYARRHDCATHFLQFVHVLNRIQQLDLLRFDIRDADGAEATEPATPFLFDVRGAEQRPIYRKSILLQCSTRRRSGLRSATMTLSLGRA